VTERDKVSFERLIDELRDGSVWERFTPAGDVRDGLRELQKRVDAVRSGELAAEAKARELLATEASCTTSWFGIAARSEDRDPAVVRQILAIAADMRFREVIEAKKLQHGAIFLASTLAESAGRDDVLGYAHKELANTYVLLNEYRAALDALNDAEGYYQNVPCNEVPLAVVTLVRAVVHERLDHFQDALAYATAAAATFERYGESALLLKSRTAIANIYHGVGRFEDARLLWRELITAADQQGDLPTVAQISSNLGLCLYELRRPGEAVAALSEALAIYEELGNVIHPPRVRRTLANIQRGRGEWMAALKLLRRAHEEFERNGSGLAACEVTIDIAEMLIEKGDFAGAKSLLEPLPRRFADAGHYRNAIVAVAYLREAVRKNQGTPELIRLVKQFVVETRRHPELTFAPPPDRALNG
jgi:tetratricopeptide (TPR) repeat protein